MTAMYGRIGLGVLLLVGCSGDESEDPPVVRSAVLITLDTTTPDALDIYGENAGITPHLSALAAESVVFDRARSVAPITLPSHASMHTGLYPMRHDVRGNGYRRLPDAAQTLAELAQASDVQTGAFVAAAVLNSPFGLGQGFDVYGDAEQVERATGTISERFCRFVTMDAITWLDQRDPERPYFLWAHYFDPHRPLNPPPKFLAQAGQHLYLGEVAAMDNWVGKLIERIKAEPDYHETTIIVLADHGEAHGANGEDTHGLLLHDATLRIPFLVRFAGSAHGGTRRADLVSSVDVMPTLAAGMGLQFDHHIDGLNLREPVERKGVYSENYNGFLAHGWAQEVGWATEEGLYVHGPDRFVDTDPNDYTLTPLEGEDPAWVSEALVQLGHLSDAAPLPRPEGDSMITSNFESLGYAGAGGAELDVPAPLDETGRPSPHSKLSSHDRLWKALALVDRGRLDNALEALGTLVEENPGNPFMKEQLGGAFIEAKRFEEARDAFMGVIDLGYDRPSVRRQLAFAFANLGQFKKAEQELDRYEQLAPGDKDLEVMRADLQRARAGALGGSGNGSANGNQ